MDADAYEELIGENHNSRATTPDQLAADEVSENPEPPSIQIETVNSETAELVVIDQFPSGNPGAPIPDVPRGPSAFESRQTSLIGSESLWAPFRSQQDWEFARWAKTCGMTSSAVTKLLAIPEV